MVLTIEWVNGSWVWKLKWRREWFTWETLLVCDLMREMEGVRLKQCTCDEVVFHCLQVLSVKEILLYIRFALVLVL